MGLADRCLPRVGAVIPILKADFKTRGLIAVERLMGMVLITVSIQMLITGIRVAIKDAG